MKRFVWRLQRVLDIKEKEEQSKRAELLRLTGKLAAIRSELLRQQRILMDIINDLGKEMPNKRLTQQELFLKCSKTNDELIKKLEKEVANLESQQKKKIAEVLKVRRFRKGLEKLREQAKKRFIEEQEKLEQKEMDERTAIGFARKIIVQE